MAHMTEIRCFGCGKHIGTCVDGDIDALKVIERSLREHEMHWCPKKGGYDSSEGIPLTEETKWQNTQ